MPVLRGWVGYCELNANAVWVECCELDEVVEAAAGKQVGSECNLYVDAFSAAWKRGKRGKETGMDGS